MAKTAKKTTGKSKKLAFRPLEDRVLIEASEAETVSAGGILLPDSAQERPQIGTIRAAGPGRLNRNGDRVPMSVAVGDQVLFGKYAGNDVEIEGTTYKVMRADELLAKIDG